MIEQDLPVVLIQLVRLGLDFILNPKLDTLKSQYKHMNVPASFKKSKGSNKVHQVLTSCKHFLSENNILVLDTDKNMGPCLISNSKYIELSDSILCDQSTFMPLTITSDHDIVQEYVSVVKNLSCHHLLIPESNKSPVFRGMPKVHKNPIKLRPVVNASNCFTTKLSKLLLAALKTTKDLISNMNDFLVSSTDKFIEKLGRIPSEIVSSLHMDALDIESLYTNIPHDLLINAIDHFLCYQRSNTLFFKFEGKYVTLSSNEVLKLSKIYLEFNVLFDPKRAVWYRQTKGIPTGGNVSPVLADIVLSYCEMKIKDDHISIWNQYRYSGRYLDDLLVLTTDESYSPSKFQDLFYSNKFILKETGSKIRECVFLDLEVKQECEKNLFSYKLYRKPGNAYSYIHEKSFLPLHVKRSFIWNEFERIKRRCFYEVDIERESKFFEDNLLTRGYSKAFITSCKTFSSRQSTVESKHWLVYPYQIDIPKSTLVLNLKDSTPIPENVQISFRNQKALIKYLQ